MTKLRAQAMLPTKRAAAFEQCFALLTQLNEIAELERIAYPPQFKTRPAMALHLLTKSIERVGWVAWHLYESLPAAPADLRQAMRDEIMLLSEGAQPERIAAEKRARCAAPFVVCLIDATGIDPSEA